MCGLAALCMKCKQLLLHWTIFNSQKQKELPSIPLMSLAFHWTVQWCNKNLASYGLQATIAGIPFVCLKIIVIVLPSLRASWFLPLDVDLSLLYRFMLEGQLLCKCKVPQFKWCLINFVFLLCRNNTFPYPPKIKNDWKGMKYFTDDYLIKIPELYCLPDDVNESWFNHFFLMVIFQTCHAIVWYTTPVAHQVHIDVASDKHRFLISNCCCAWFFHTDDSLPAANSQTLTLTPDLPAVFCCSPSLSHFQFVLLRVCSLFIHPSNYQHTLLLLDVFVGHKNRPPWMCHRPQRDNIFIPPFFQIFNIVAFFNSH